jgi:hypothetical protein
MSHPLPSEVAFAKHVSGILGKPTEIKAAAAPYDPKPDDPFILAVYIDDAGKPSAIGLCDVPIGASMGACLTMIPAGVAKDDIKAKKLSEALLDNLKEVFNISASLFNLPGAPHLRLGPVHVAPPALPADIAAMLAQNKVRVDFQCTVPVYGGGLFSFRRLD